MIQVHVRLDDDNELPSVWMRSAPREGENIWYAGQDADEVRKLHGTSSFLIKDVAHWVSPSWNTTHHGEPNHTMCVYVEKNP